MLDAVTNRNGEDLIDTKLRRNTHGLLVTIKAHPKIEEFMRRLSGGEVVTVNTVGRNWLTSFVDPISKHEHIYSEKPLEAYGLTQPLDNFIVNGLYVDFARLGHSFVTDNGQLNMSYLRLIGISNPNGVKFLIRTVQGLSGLKTLRDNLQEAQNRFITEYIKTVEFCVTTASQTF